MRGRRSIFILASCLLPVLAVVYFGLSWFVADRLSRPERHPLAVTPDDFGLIYESVEFESVKDGLRLGT